jgi:flagellar protein FliS
MGYATAAVALRQYRAVHTGVCADSATPHRLIQMLMEGGLTRLAKAKGHMARGEIAAKGEQIGKALGIVGGLRNALDMRHGGEIAQNLNALYDYMERRLVQANLNSDPAILDEVAGLLREIKSAWDAIGD